MLDRRFGWLCQLPPTTPRNAYFAQILQLAAFCVPLCGWRKVKEGESQFYLYCVNCKSFLKNYWFFLELIWPNNACLCECCWLCYFVLCRGVQHWPRSEAAWFCVCSLESSGGGEGEGALEGKSEAGGCMEAQCLWHTAVLFILDWS